MMKFRYIFPLMAIMVMSGCIGDEEPNAECDITSADLPGDIMIREAVINNNKVSFVVKSGVDVNSLSPEFTVTPGAVLDPPSGTPRNFTLPQVYVVTSESGKWCKEYYVEVTTQGISTLLFTFDNVRQMSSSRYCYDIFYEQRGEEETFAWASGNLGFALTGRGTMDPASFPTYQVTLPGGEKAVRMVTRLTGTWGAGVNKPIAAGNLFLGNFDVTHAVLKPMEATQFGMPFDRIPYSFRGRFMYTPGEKYYELDKTVKDKLKPIEGRVDECNVYAVFYETAPGAEFLTGDNVLTSPNIVSVAAIPANLRGKSDDWVEFDLPFAYRPGKSVDPQKLKDGKYNLAVVCTSSIEGDFFSGAPGSTLTVDELEVTCEN